MDTHPSAGVAKVLWYALHTYEQGAGSNDGPGVPAHFSAGADYSLATAAVHAKMQGQPASPVLFVMREAVTRLTTDMAALRDVRDLHNKLGIIARRCDFSEQYHSPFHQ